MGWRRRRHPGRGIECRRLPLQHRKLRLQRLDLDGLGFVASLPACRLFLSSVRQLLDSGHGAERVAPSALHVIVPTLPVFELAAEPARLLLTLVGGMGQPVDLDQQLLILGTELLVVRLQAVGMLELSLPEVPLSLSVLRLPLAGGLVYGGLAAGLGPGRHVDGAAQRAVAQRRCISAGERRRGRYGRSQTERPGRRYGRRLGTDWGARGCAFSSGRRRRARFGGR